MSENTKLTEKISAIMKELGIEDSVSRDNKKLEELIKNAAFKEWKYSEELNIAFSSILQVRQIRLFCLVTEVFENRIPSEHQVASLFHITVSSAKSLLNNILASFEKELEDSLFESCRKLILSAEKDKSGEFYRLPAGNNYLISKVNEMLKTNGNEMSRIKPLPANRNFFWISNDLYEFYEKGGGK